MKRILHYITLAAFIAMSGYTSPLQHIMGWRSTNALSAMYTKNFPTCTLAAALIGGVVGCAYKARNYPPQELFSWEKTNEQLDDNTSGFNYVRIKKPAIESIKKGINFSVTTNIAHTCSEYDEWLKNWNQNKNQNDLIINVTSSNSQYPGTTSYTFFLNAQKCVALLNQKLQKDNLKTHDMLRHYPSIVKEAIAKNLWYLYNGETDKGKLHLYADYCMAHTQLFASNIATLASHCATNYTVPFLAGGALAAAALPIAQRYPRATVALGALHMICSAYEKHTAQNNNHG